MMKPFIPDKLPLDAISWDSHVSLIGQANAALARYDGMLQGVPNPAVFLSPLTTQEALLSSKIEGTLVASVEEVLEFEANPRGPIEPSKQTDIQEIINYRTAMWKAIDRLKERPLCLNIIKELHAILLDSVRGLDKARGEFRRTQNYIAPPGSPIEQATYVPPAPELLDAVLDNWEKYIHFDEKDTLVHLAIVKAQFEIIHPFLDGNGRLGRMLIPLFLFDKKLLSSPMFYLSAYLESNREIYYKRLQATSQQHDWDGWIQFFLNAVVEQAAVNTDKIQGILSLYEDMKTRMVETTHSQFAIQALDAIFSTPVFQGSDFTTLARISNRGTANTLVRQLLSAEILRVLHPASGRRSALLAFPELINLVEGRSIV
jgi:Fic family protein